MAITENTRFTFGQYKDKRRLREVPDSYLEWVKVNLKDSDFHEWAIAADTELQRRKRENDAVGSLEEQADLILQRAGFKVDKRLK